MLANFFINMTSFRKGSFENTPAFNNKKINKPTFIARGKSLPPLTFCGKEQFLNQVKTLACPDPVTISNLACNSNKTPIIISDFDGTLVGHFGDPDRVITSEPDSPNNRVNLEKTFDTLKEAGIPLVILTAGKDERFFLNTMFGDSAEKLNVVALKGNQMRLTLPNTPVLNSFIKEKQSKGNGKAYNISVSSSSKGRIKKIKLEPNDILDMGQESVLQKDLEQELSPLGFRVENNKVIIALHSRELRNSYDKACENGKNYEINNVPKNVFDNIKSACPGSDSPKNKIVIKSNGRQIQISCNELLNYGQNKFGEICQKHLGEKLLSKNENELDDYLGELEEEGTLDQKIYTEGRAYISANKNMTAHLNDMRIYSFNKGHATEQILNMFGNAENLLPIFLGDAIGVGADDEYGIKKAKSLGGIGICVHKTEDSQLKHENRQNFRVKTSIIERGNKLTSAKYRLDSFVDTPDFLQQLAKNFKND